MNTIEITSVLKKKVKRNINFLGVLACDQLPNIIINSVPAIVVINTQPSTMPGAHWLAVYIDRYRYGYFFDSFGHAPTYHDFPEDINIFLQKNCIDVCYSKKQVQNDGSVTCGQHCIYLLCHIQSGITYQKVLDMYGPDLHCNDMMVCKFVSRIRPETCKNHDFICVQCVQCVHHV